jgi:hypothetical protein
MNGRASNTSIFASFALAPPVIQQSFAEQSTDWYGTVRGRAGWLATPNLLLFGTGGFAYGRVAGSANYVLNSTTFVGSFGIVNAPFGATCTVNLTCFAGSSSVIRTGWTAGGGLEWLLDQHWSAKVEYQFVDLGTETIRVTALSTDLITAHCCTPATLSINKQGERHKAFTLRVQATGRGDVAEASHENRNNTTKSVSSCPHAQFVSANLVAESTDRGRCPCDCLDIFFRISNRQNG